MRVVDHAEHAAAADRLEAARHAGRLRERVEHLVLREAQRDADGVGGGQVERVEPAQHLVPPLVAVDAEPQPVERVVEHLDAHVGGRGRAERDDVGGRVGRHRRRGGVVGVDDGDGRRVQAVEQPLLGVVVLGERLVVVEVVLGQVGKDGDVEREPADAVEREPVARHLHRGRRAAALDAGAQEALERRRLGRREGRRVALGPDPVLDRPDEPGRLAERGQQVVEQEDRRGLAVRAGHAEEGEVVAGPSVDVPRNLRQRGSRIRRRNESRAGEALTLPQGYRGRRRAGGQPALGDESGRGAARERVVDEVVAVAAVEGVRADRREQDARPRLAAVDGHVRDQRVGRADGGAGQPARGEPVDEVGQRRRSDVDRGGLGVERAHRAWAVSVTEAGSGRPAATDWRRTVPWPWTRARRPARGATRRPGGRSGRAGRA